MTTNLTALIVSLLVTNVSESIDQPRNDFVLTPNLEAVYRGGNQWSFPVPSPTKRVTTEVYDHRLLILEAEGITFTNVLASVRKLRKEETYAQVTPAPQWVIHPDRTYVDTNPPVNFVATNGIMFNAIYFTNALFTTNSLLVITNDGVKYIAFPPPK